MCGYHAASGPRRIALNAIRCAFSTRLLRRLIPLFMPSVTDVSGSNNAAAAGKKNAGRRKCR